MSSAVQPAAANAARDMSGLSPTGRHDLSVVTPHLHKVNSHGNSNHQKLIQSFSSGQEKIIREANAEKLGVDFAWKPRTLRLTHEHLWLTARASGDDDNVDSNVGHDYIPLHEVVSIRPSNEIQFESLPDLNESSTPSSRIMKGVVTLASSLRPSSKKLVNESNAAPTNTFDLVTDEKGINCGRRYTFRMESSAVCKEWMDMLNKESHRRSKEVANLTILQYLQKKARRIYDSSLCQYVVAALIIFNFVLNAYQAEFNPQTLGDSESNTLFHKLDVALTSIFAVELVINAFGHWFWDFVHDGWSMFDLVVVVFSVVSLFIDDIPFFSILRVVRAFRILRVIKRFQSLRRIFNAVIHSIIPVANALFIAIMVVAIYTIIGVFLFADGSSEFGSFGRAMYTLFELLAFTVWPNNLPAFEARTSGGYLTDTNVIIFVVSFVAVVSWTMLQVLVAVLLDNFMSATAEDRAQQLIALRAETKAKNMGPFDPLLYTLIDGADTEKELMSQIRAVWRVIDVDGTGAADFEAVREGLLKLNLSPRVRLTEEDFAGATEDYALCDADRRLSSDGFHALIHRQLAHYVQRHLSDAGALASPHGEGEAILQGLKLMLMEQSRSQGGSSDPAFWAGEQSTRGSPPPEQRLAGPAGVRQSWGGARNGWGRTASSDRGKGAKDAQTPMGDDGLGMHGGGARVEVLEAQVAATQREVAELRRVQAEEVLPQLQALRHASREILAAVAALGGQPLSSMSGSSVDVSAVQPRVLSPSPGNGDASYSVAKGARPRGWFVGTDAQGADAEFTDIPLPGTSLQQTRMHVPSGRTRSGRSKGGVVTANLVTAETTVMVVDDSGKEVGLC